MISTLACGQGKIRSDPIPDPGVKKAPDPGSRIRIRNTACTTRRWIVKTKSLWFLNISLKKKIYVFFQSMQLTGTVSCGSDNLNTKKDGKVNNCRTTCGPRTPGPCCRAPWWPAGWWAGWGSASSGPALPPNHSYRHSPIHHSLTVPIPSDLEHLIINLSTGGLLLASTPTQPFLGIHQSIIHFQFQFHRILNIW